MIDGRLFRQAATLALASERAVLVLEGCDQEWRETGVRREAVQGALITIGVFFGVAVLQSDDPEETARLLGYLGQQARRAAQGGLPRQLFLLQGLPGVGPERAARLLLRSPEYGYTLRRAASFAGKALALAREAPQGLGPPHGPYREGRAAAPLGLSPGLCGPGQTVAYIIPRIVARFGSVQAVMAASADELATVDGIGEKTAAKMRWAVQEPAVEYDTPPRTVGLT